MHIRKIVAVAAVTLCCAGFAAVPVMGADSDSIKFYADEKLPGEDEDGGYTKDSTDVVTQTEEGGIAVQPYVESEQSIDSIEVPPLFEITTLGDAYQLDVVVDGTVPPNKLKWEILSGTDVIQLNSKTGTVTAFKKGEAVIRVSLSDNPAVYAECKIVVQDLLNGICPDPTAQTESRFYYVDGKLQHITGIIDVQNSWYNLVDGQVVGNTVAQKGSAWWYINEDGVADFEYTGLAANSSGWWRIEDGQVNFDYTGFTENEEGWWYLEGGHILFDRTEVIWGTVDGEDAWWYVCGGHVEEDYTGLAANSSGWWRIEDGQVNFDYAGFTENEEGWWYLEGGHILFDRTEVIWGTVNGEDAWWNVEGGVVKFTDTVAPNSSGWWCIKNGKVDFNFTGIAPNSSGWWRIVNGCVDFNCNSVEQNEYGWWYIRNGCVDFSYTGIAPNSSGWWRIVNGCVDFNCNSVEQNEYGWWYIRNGCVDFSYTGIAPNSSGWWRIVNGCVDFNCNSVEQNEYGWWYIRNGCVDFGFNGVGTNSSGAWYIRGGCVDFGYTGYVDWNGHIYSVVGGNIQTNGVDFNMYQTAQGQTSKTNYLLLVDTELCRVGVFAGSYGQWTPIAYWPCSPGTSATPTVKGSFTVASKGKVFGKAGQYSCWYYTQFYGNYLFHSVLYYPGSMTQIKDGRLGMKLSHGCVRLDINNAKWIWDTIPAGTKVYIY